MKDETIATVGWKREEKRSSGQEDGGSGQGEEQEETVRKMADVQIGWYVEFTGSEKESQE